MVEGKLRISSTQLISNTCKDDNLKKIEKYTAIAREMGSDVVIYPESFMFYSPVEETADIRAVKSESLEGPFVSKMKEISRINKIAQIVGIHESVPNDHRVYNTIIAIDKEGRIMSTYRKTHLYDAFGFRESKIYKASDNNFQTFDFEGIKMGMMVCYEVRFPEIARSLALQGSDVIVVPSAWVRGFGKEDQWTTLIKARALENTLYIVTANQIGNVYAGITSVVDPMGIVIARASEGEGILAVDIEKERIREVRDRLPTLSQRREELYAFDKHSKVQFR